MNSRVTCGLVFFYLTTFFAVSRADYKLPYPEGEKYLITRGNHEGDTHVGKGEYAWDFGMSVGDIVVSAKAGTVIKVKKDSNRGGNSIEYNRDANFVIIYHGDGTEALYLHLRYNSVHVKVGDHVIQGEPIAESGRTGYVSGPHLHFQVQKLTPPDSTVYWGQSIPVSFSDPDVNRNSGVPKTGEWYTSSNPISFSNLFVASVNQNGGSGQVGKPQGIQEETVAGVRCLVQKYTGGQFGESIVILDRTHRFPEAYLIRTGFYEWWINNKNTIGPPFNDEYRYGEGSRQDFQNGYLTWNSTNGVRVLTYSAPGQYSDGFRVRSRAFVMAYNRNGAALNVGKAFPAHGPNDLLAPATVHTWGATNYEVQDFKDGLTGWGWNAIIRHPDYEGAYLIRTGFWETYKLQNGPIYFGAPLDDEYLNYSGAFGYGWPRQDFEKGFSMIWNPILKKVHVLKNDNAIFNVLFGAGGGPSDDTPIAAVYIPNGGEIWQAGTIQRITWSAKDDVGVTRDSLQYSIDDGINWLPIATFQNGQTVQYSWVVPNTISSTCRIRVIAYDAAGNIGIDQSDGTFTISAAGTSLSAPTMYDPSVSGQNYNIAWTSVSGAQSYVLQEDTTPSFSNPIEYNTNLTARYFSNRADGDYYYRVSAVNTQGRGAWSNTKYVTVIRNQPPGEITNMLPANGVTNQPLSVTLSWKSVHPTGEKVKFNVWFAPTETDLFYPQHLISAQQIENTYTVTGLSYNTICSWRIEAVDETGDKRESPIFHFTTIGDNTPPTGNITINDGAATTNTYSVSLRLSSSDSESGVAYMRFSNDGQNWSEWFYYSTNHPGWNLSESRFGGKPAQTTYTVYAQFKDKQGNVSTTYRDTIDKTPGTPGIITLNGIDYATINDAITASVSGDTVFLTEGVYAIQGKENPPRYSTRSVGIVLKSGLTLMGSGADKTKLILEGIGLYTVIDANNSVVQGLTIINSDANGVRYAILAESNSSKIRNCTLQGSYGGIEVRGDNVEISNDLIVNNSVEGIRNSGSNTKIYNNTIGHNSNNGIGVAGSGSNATIKNNIFISPVQVPTNTVFQNNNVYPKTNYSNQNGLLSDQTGINGNISADPLFVNLSAGDFRLSSNSPCINAGSNVGIPANGLPDIGTFEYNGTGAIRVESNRPDATFTITGTQNYTGNGTGWSTSNAPIGIYSIAFSPISKYNTPHYASKVLRSNETLVFDGYYAPDKEPPECKISVNYGEYATADSIVDITLSASDKVAGLGTGAQMQFSNNGSTWSPLEPFSTIKKGFDLTAYGGTRSPGPKAVYAKVSDALGNFTPAITDTILYVPNRRILEVPRQFSRIQAAVDSAQAGDVVWVAPGFYQEDVVLKPGIRLQGSGPKLTTLDDVSSFAVKAADNCVIDGFNLTGGFEAVEIYNASPIISNNIITASRGITIGADSHPIIRNNTITARQIGIFIPVPQVTPVIENNTIFGSEQGILLYGGDANTRVEVSNNIIANNKYGVMDDNTSDQNHTHIFASFNLFWNNANGGLAGINKDKISNISDLNADPRFANSTNGDFSLRSDSPAVNSGNPEAKYNDVNDTPNDRGVYGGPSANMPPLADFTLISRNSGIPMLPRDVAYRVMKGVLFQGVAEAKGFRDNANCG